jgi:DNA-binding transcriptional MocR family regulator
MHLVGWLRDGSADAERVSRSAWEAGVEAAPLSRYAVQARVAPAVLLGFAAVRPSEMGAGLKALRHAIVAATR